MINNVEELSASPMFAEITGIPLQMLVTSEQYRGFADTLEETKVQNFPFSTCGERCFERLPGYVDVSILSMDGLCSVSDEPF